MCSSDWNWGAEQARNGNNVWSGNMNDTERDGYNWTKWNMENERRMREEDHRRSASHSYGTVEHSGYFQNSNNNGSSNLLSGFVENIALLAVLLFCGIFIVSQIMAFIMKYWAIILSITALTLTVVAFGYMLRRQKPNGWYFRVKKRIFQKGKNVNRYSLAQIRTLKNGAARMRRKCIAKWRGRPLPPLEKIRL